MTYNKKKWFIFLNILLNLGLSSSLVALDQTSPSEHDSSNESNTSESELEFNHNEVHTGANKSIQNTAIVELSIEEAILREQLLIEEYTQQELLNEYIFLEELSIAEHYHHNVTVEEWLLDELLNTEIQNKHNQQDGNFVLAKTTTREKLEQVEDSVKNISLAYDSVYLDDRDSKKKILRILTSGDFKRLSTDVKKSVKEQVSLIKLAQFKSGAKELLDIQTTEKLNANRKLDNQENNIKKLLALKEEAKFLASSPVIQTIKPASEVSVTTVPKHSVQTLSSEKNDVEKSNQTLEKLANLKNVVAELSTREAVKHAIQANQIVKDNDTITKLTALKKLAVDLSAENTTKLAIRNEKILKSKPVICRAYCQ